MDWIEDLRRDALETELLQDRQYLWWLAQREQDAIKAGDCQEAKYLRKKINRLKALYKKRR